MCARAPGADITESRRGPNPQADPNQPTPSRVERPFRTGGVVDTSPLPRVRHRVTQPPRSRVLLAVLGSMAVLLVVGGIVTLPAHFDSTSTDATQAAGDGFYPTVPATSSSSPASTAAGVTPPEHRTVPPTSPRAVSTLPLLAGTVYYPGCREARAAGVAPMYRGQPGYRAGLDADDDGIACDPTTTPAPSAPTSAPPPSATDETTPPPSTSETTSAPSEPQGSTGE